jgi:uncharacterized membrane protein YeaQ/YmgE (transglycosylase-associated protein family)
MKYATFFLTLSVLSLIVALAAVLASNTDVAATGFVVTIIAGAVGALLDSAA